MNDSSRFDGPTSLAEDTFGATATGGNALPVTPLQRLCIGFCGDTTDCRAVALVDLVDQHLIAAHQRPGLNDALRWSSVVRVAVGMFASEATRLSLAARNGTKHDTGVAQRLMLASGTMTHFFQLFETERVVLVSTSGAQVDGDAMWTQIQAVTPHFRIALANRRHPETGKVPLPPERQSC